MNTRTYYDFAENDKVQLELLFESGSVSSIITSSTQNYYEKYLKQIIEDYFPKKTATGEMERQDLLRAHSLKKLLRMISEKLKVNVPRQLYMGILLVDGFHFNTRYPGDESFFATADDIEDCKIALKACISFVEKTLIDLYLESVNYVLGNYDECVDCIIDIKAIDLLSKVSSCVKKVEGNKIEITKIPKQLLTRTTFLCKEL